MKLLVSISSVVVGSCIILYFFSFIPLPVLSQNTIFVVRQTEDNSIVRLRNDLKTTQTLYESNKYRTHSLTVSPNNKYIAFIEETKPEYTKDGYLVVPQYRLIILNDSGNIISYIEKDVKRYVWSPDGEQIAFLTFAPCDPDYEFKCPTGAWVYSINSTQLKRIADQATEINWAQFDSSIYLYFSGTVTRWNPRSAKTDTTEHKDIYFSPDGKYYLRMWKNESKPIQLYESQTNNIIFDIRVYEKLLRSGESVKLIPDNIGDLWSSYDLEYPHGWAFHSGHLLLFTKPDITIETEGEGQVKVVKSRKVNRVQNFLFDPDQKKIVTEFDGAISPWIGSGSQLIIEQNGKIVTKTYREVQK